MALVVTLMIPVFTVAAARHSGDFEFCFEVSGNKGSELGA